MPGLHHVWARVYKDLFCRFRTMDGAYVARRAGWDTHGLPVEVEVEKKLGITGKQQIEEQVGIAEFTRLCRESVYSYVDEFARLTTRIGYWVDMDAAYWTLSPDYIESVWWHLQQLFDQGLLYEDLKVVPYCPRCGTALVEPRAGPGRRLPRRGGRVGLRPAPPARRRPGRCRRGAVVGRVDDDTLDPPVEHGRGREPPADLRRGGRDAGGRGARRRRAGRGGAGPHHLPRAGRGPPRPALPASLRRPARPPRSRRVARRPRLVRHHRGRHRPGAHGAGLRRGRPPDRPRARSAFAQPGGARWAVHVRDLLAGRARRARGQPRHQRPVGGDRPVDAAPALRALVPALLAVPHPADLLGQAELVHRHVDAQGRSPGGQRHGGLASGVHPRRPIRRMAGQQRGLGPVPGPLLGDPTAHLALRARPPALRRLALGAVGPVRTGRHRHRPTPAHDRRGHVRVLDLRRRGGGRGCPVGGPARRTGHRRLVRFGLHAGGPGGLPPRPGVRGGVRLPGGLHFRGHRPDALDGSTRSLP